MPTQWLIMFVFCCALFALMGPFAFEAIVSAWSGYEDAMQMLNEHQLKARY